MRDRLIKLLQLNPHFDVLWFGGWEEIADYLLENGVIVPPCKVGDVVYVEPKAWRSAYSFINYDHIFANKYYIVADVVSIVKTRKQTLVKLGTYNRATFTREYERYPISAIGKTVFFTKEDAEKTLKGVKE